MLEEQPEEPRPSTPFGERLRALREARGWSRLQLVKVAGLDSIDSLGDWERGEAQCRIDKLVKVANALDVSTDYLLGRVDEPEFPVGRVMVDIELERRMLAARTIDELEPHLMWKPTVAIWSAEVPANYALLSMKEFRKREKCLAKHLRKFEAHIRARWREKNQ